jgi:hypothetical protein
LQLRRLGIEKSNRRVYALETQKKRSKNKRGCHKYHIQNIKN